MALDVLMDEKELMGEESAPTFSTKQYIPEIMFPKLSKLRIFIFKGNVSVAGGLIFVSAKTLKNAKAKIKRIVAQVRFVGEVTSLQELLEVLTPYKEKIPKELNRKDVWNFTYAQEFY